MHEHVVSGRPLNEAVAFGGVEPLNCTFLFHSLSPKYCARSNRVPKKKSLRLRSDASVTANPDAMSTASAVSHTKIRRIKCVLAIPGRPPGSLRSVFVPAAQVDARLRLA